MVDGSIGLDGHHVLPRVELVIKTAREHVPILYL